MSEQSMQFAVYTIRRSQELDNAFAKGGGGRFTERKRWVAALGLFEEAKRNGSQLPIIFADAGDTCDGLLYYGFVRELSADDSTTTCHFEGLCRVAAGTQKHSLRLRSTGKPLSDDFIKPYAIVHTPGYIRAA
jgi:hypothetical protein